VLVEVFEEVEEVVVAAVTDPVPVGAAVEVAVDDEPVKQLTASGTVTP
jgi:hypothetical protein